MKKIFLLIAIGICLNINAAELKCNVTVNASQVQGTNKQIFESLKKQIEDLMNNTNWTDLTFAPNEKIDCSIGLVVKSVADNLFTCEMQIQARRPVWGSNYSTTLLNFRDQSVNFTYQEFQPFNITGTYDDNITAILAYYAYIIIGYSLDSFQKLGGTPYFNQAENIVNLSQNRTGTEGDGWKAFTKNNKRYELVNNLLDERFRKFREYYYDYHRLGLDAMTSNTDNARAKIAEGLPVLKEVNRMQPQALAIISFLDAKGDEFVNIFSKRGTDAEKNMAYDVLTAINPTGTNRYEAIKK